MLHKSNQCTSFFPLNFSSSLVSNVVISFFMVLLLFWNWTNKQRRSDSLLPQIMMMMKMMRMMFMCCNALQWWCRERKRKKNKEPKHPIVQFGYLILFSYIIQMWSNVLEMNGHWQSLIALLNCFINDDLLLLIKSKQIFCCFGHHCRFIWYFTWEWKWQYRK